MVKKWIQKARPKKGALSRQLGISEDKNIPTEMLKYIRDAPVNTWFDKTHFMYAHPKRIKVTPLLKKRANFALNVRKK